MTNAVIDDRARILELERALAFYAARHNWVYSIDKCRLEIHVNDGKLIISDYPVFKYPALEDHGQIACTALGERLSKVSGDDHAQPARHRHLTPPAGTD
jgi:hypothetical protein